MKKYTKQHLLDVHTIVVRTDTSKNREHTTNNRHIDDKKPHRNIMNIEQ